MSFPPIGGPPPHSTPAQTSTKARESKAPAIEVRVVDFDISFGSLVLLLIKVALAAIPALIALAMLGVWLAIVFRSILLR